MLMVTACNFALAQAVQSAEERHLPFSVGVGVSDFDTYWAVGNRMLGGTFWADWNPGMLPAKLGGLGLEIEARDISLGRSSDQPSNLREDTASGNLVYRWRRYRNFHPYGKAGLGMGSIDFQFDIPGYSHDTRTVYSLGGGLEYRAYRNVWVRADYEYQSWGTLLGTTFHPQGVTLGAMYSFRGPRR